MILRNTFLVYVGLLTTPLILVSTGLIFDIPQIGPENHFKDILTEGAGTYINSDGIQFTESSARNQRARYYRWLNTNDMVAITTSFAFSYEGVDAERDFPGLFSFFLARYGPLVTKSGTLRRPNEKSAPFVDVEVDTYRNNDWDPSNITEVGIVFKAVFECGNLTIKACSANVHYDFTSRMLSVSVTNNQSEFKYSVDVDLSKELSDLVFFGFRAYSSRRSFRRFTIKSWSFKSFDLHANQVKRRDDRKKKKIILFASVLLSTVLFGFCVSFSVWLWNKKPGDRVTSPQISPTDHSYESNHLPQPLTFEDVSQATNNFHEHNKLGEGGFGAVYIGVLPDGLRVAIKKVSPTSRQGIKEYKAEVNIVAKARHRNLVQLKGWCREREGEFILVYELMVNRSLDHHLFNAATPLPWNRRYKIARDIATALRYLHEECSQCILHRDIKSSNVMLDSEFRAKIGDFGMAKLIDHNLSSNNTNPAGTVGYLAPECISSGKVSRQSDVYSYGVVALEIATGRKSIDRNAPENQQVLIEWVRELYKTERILEAVDQKLGDGQYHVNQIKGLITIGLWCVLPYPNQRPTIDAVLRLLNNEDDPLSDLRQPMPTLVPIPLSHANEFNEVSNPDDVVALGSAWTAGLHS